MHYWMTRENSTKNVSTSITQCDRLVREIKSMEVELELIGSSDRSRMRSPMSSGDLNIDRFDSPAVNILLVDDIESNLLALETILDGPDRNLVRAGSGEEALQYLLYNEVAVIVLD